MRASGSYVPTYVRVLPPCLGAPLLSCAPLSLASLLDANLYPPPWPLQTKRKGHEPLCCSADVDNPGPSARTRRNYSKLKLEPAKAALWFLRGL